MENRKRVVICLRIELKAKQCLGDFFKQTFFVKTIHLLWALIQKHRVLVNHWILLNGSHLFKIYFSIPISQASISQRDITIFLRHALWCYFLLNYSKPKTLKFHRPWGLFWRLDLCNGQGLLHACLQWTPTPSSVSELLSSKGTDLEYNWAPQLLELL